MGRLSGYCMIRNYAYRAAEAGETMAEGWKSFSLQGLSYLEGYFSSEKIKEYFKEAFLEAKAAPTLPKEEEDDGLLPFLFDTRFSATKN